VNDDDRTLEALRRAMREGDGRPPDPPTCPDPEAIWQAVRGVSDPDRTREVIKHLRGCPSCSEEWRAAMEPRTETVRRPSYTVRWAPLLAAALVIAAFGLFLVTRRPAPELPAVRASVEPEILSELDEQAPLPRERFLLRWQAVGDDARYGVTIDRRDLTRVTEARNLDRPEFLVPESTLAEVPSGEQLVWRVEARLTDGRRITSKAFLVRLE
jgi:hypothetical protein